MICVGFAAKEMKNKRSFQNCLMIMDLLLGLLRNQGSSFFDVPFCFLLQPVEPVMALQLIHKFS